MGSQPGSGGFRASRSTLGGSIHHPYTTIHHQAYTTCGDRRPTASHRALDAGTSRIAACWHVWVRPWAFHRASRARPRRRLEKSCCHGAEAMDAFQSAGMERRWATQTSRPYAPFPWISDGAAQPASSSISQHNNGQDELSVEEEAMIRAIEAAAAALRHVKRGQAWLAWRLDAHRAADRWLAPRGRHVRPSHVRLHEPRFGRQAGDASSGNQSSLSLCSRCLAACKTWSGVAGLAIRCA